MGAWEIQTANDTSRGNVMRQVVPVWPACWGYSCSGPTTYFGPAQFNDSTKISFDVLLEDHASIHLVAGSSLVLNTSGVWSFDKKSGTDLDFKVGQWNTVEMEIGRSASFNGKVLATSDHDSAGHGTPIKLSMDRYIFAQVDNFSIEAA